MLQTGRKLFNKCHPIIDSLLEFECKSGADSLRCWTSSAHVAWGHVCLILPAYITGRAMPTMTSTTLSQVFPRYFPGSYHK